MKKLKTIGKSSRTHAPGENVNDEEGKAGALVAKQIAPATTHRLPSKTVGADSNVVRED